MPRRTTDYRGLTEQSRVRLLHAVQRAPARCLKDLAAEADVHINTARDHLRILESEGFVFSAPVDTGKRGRPPMGYWPVQRSEHSPAAQDRKSTRLNSSHVAISYAVFCLKQKKTTRQRL